MEWLGAILGVLFLIGVGLAVREWRTGRGRILDERPIDTDRTEAERDALRAADAFRGDGGARPHQ